MREDTATGSREAITVRFPSGTLSDARKGKAERESMNDLIAQAFQAEIARRRGMQALERIRKIREQVGAESGNQEDSGPLIRALREGEERRD